MGGSIRMADSQGPEGSRRKSCNNGFLEQNTTNERSQVLDDSVLFFLEELCQVAPGGTVALNRFAVLKSRNSGMTRWRVEH